MIREYIKLTSSSGQLFQFSNFRRVSIERELDDITSSMTFETAADSEISSIMSKYDYFEYYIKPTDSDKFICSFRGYIDTKTKQKSKTDRSVQWSCLDKLSKFSRTNMEYPINIPTLKPLLDAIIDQVNEKLPGFLTFDVRVDGTEIIMKNVESSTNILEYLRNIRENTILYIYYEPELDKVVITTPLYLQYQYRTAGLPVYEFDSKNNMLGTLSYGDISSDINAVVYYGRGNVTGIAVDFSNYGSNQEIRPLYKYDYSSGSKEDLETKARNDLLDIMRNFLMNFSISFTEQSIKLELGSLCTINDEDEFNGTRFFIISKKTITVSKDDILISLTVRASTLQDFPEDLVLDNFGITDIDTLEVNQKITGDLE